MAEGVSGTSYDDPSLPAPGTGYTYLVLAQSFDCGMGTLGWTSSEVERTNANGGACQGKPHTDSHASSESTVFGMVNGSYLDTVSSNDMRETITEVLSGGSPSSRFSRLEQRWNVTVAPGSRIELHVEGFRTISTDADNFQFEYSTDNGASFSSVAMQDLPFADDGIDRIGSLPSTLSGNVIIRVVDTDRTAGHQTFDTVSIDELWVRSVP